MPTLQNSLNFVQCILTYNSSVYIFLERSSQKMPKNTQNIPLIYACEMSDNGV
jgi:hypothetical protein